MDRSPNNFDPNAGDANVPGPGPGPGPGHGHAHRPAFHARPDAGLLADEVRDFDGAIGRQLAGSRGVPAGMADRIFAASREHLPSPEEAVGVGADFSSDVVGTIGQIGSEGWVAGRGRGVVTRSSRQVRWARMALAAAAVLAVVTGSWIALQPTSGGHDDSKLIADGSQANDGSGNGIGNRPLPAPSASQPINGPINAPANAAAEMTLVAMQYPNQYRTWISEETLGGSEAARLAAPVLRTQGAAIDDIEGELEAILGFPSAGLSGTGGSPESAGFGSL